MLVTAIRFPYTERNRLDRCLRRAERRLIWPNMTPSLGLKHPQPDVCARPSRVRSEEMLDRMASVGDCRATGGSTWGPSAKLVLFDAGRTAKGPPGSSRVGQEIGRTRCSKSAIFIFPSAASMRCRG
jgi:hypothetical protein